MVKNSMALNHPQVKAKPEDGMSLRFNRLRTGLFMNVAPGGTGDAAEQSLEWVGGGITL